MGLTPILVLLLISIMSSFSYALDKPEGKVILTVSGAINVSNSDQGAEFDLAMLEALPQYSITTHTPWSNGSYTYQGFSAVDLVMSLGSESKQLQVMALNDYIAEIPLSDFIENKAIFAIFQDGQPIEVRKLGPIIVIYPYDELEDLKSETYYGRSVWQVSKINMISLTE